MADEKMTLMERLLNPAWRDSPNSGSPDLNVAQTIETMREAAERIAQLENRAAMAVSPQHRANET